MKSNRWAIQIHVARFKNKNNYIGSLPGYMYVNIDIIQVYRYYNLCKDKELRNVY